jgi:hypothetical protein
LSAHAHGATVRTTAPPEAPEVPPAVVDVLTALRAYVDEPPHGRAREAPWESALRDVARTVKAHPAYAVELTSAVTPLLTHADARATTLASSACLELLDVVPALPEAVVDALLPTLAALLEWSVGNWSFRLSLYRFARFPGLRTRAIDAALQTALASRSNADASIAVLRLEDLVIGLQRANALDEPRVTAALVAFIGGQDNEGVRRAAVAYLLAEAPHVVARALATHPALFPSVEVLHHLDTCGVTTHQARVDGLAAAAPLALLEATLLDRSDRGRRMAAALAAPAAARAHPPARVRLTSLVGALFDDDREHRGTVEDHMKTFGASTVALLPFLALASLLPYHERGAIALAALTSAARGPRTFFALAALALLCDARAAAQLLDDIVADPARTPAARLAAANALRAMASAHPSAVAK